VGLLGISRKGRIGWLPLVAFDPLSSKGKSADGAPLPKRLMWMLAYWSMGVLAVGTVGFFIRFWIKT
jgi:hypothetical protein